jgi:hypothetical protein
LKRDTPLASSSRDISLYCSCCYSAARATFIDQCFDVACRDCGLTMIEIGPPLARSAPGAPIAS